MSLINKIKRRIVALWAPRDPVERNAGRELLLIKSRYIRTTIAQN